MDTHSHTATFTDLGDAVAYGDDFVAESNLADFGGIPASSFAIFETETLYGTRYEVSFVRPFAIIAGVEFPTA